MKECPNTLYSAILQAAMTLPTKEKFLLAEKLAQAAHREVDDFKEQQRQVAAPYHAKGEKVIMEWDGLEVLFHSLDYQEARDFYRECQKKGMSPVFISKDRPPPAIVRGSSLRGLP